MKESDYTKEILPKWQEEHPNSRIMRNNTGMAWQGEKKIINYDIPILTKIRPINFGVGLSIKDKKTGHVKQKGGGDYIGWETKTICELASENFKPYTFCQKIYDKNHNKCLKCKLNKKIAIFINLEIKSKTGKESPEQIKFRKTVQEAGGISVVLQEKK